MTVVLVCRMDMIDDYYLKMGREITITSASDNTVGSAI